MGKLSSLPKQEPQQSCPASKQPIKSSDKPLTIPEPTDPNPKQKNPPIA